ncbi:MAG TPA: endo-1,4-beta-xylanase [Gemmatimonadales bacterium]|nr:endo-1,4-beta-xylanase [Gemmatimonadales bacterium]
MLGLLAVLCACGHPAMHDESTLRLARPRLDIGAAVQGRALRTDSAYATAVARHFSIVTTENALKFGPLRPSRDRYDFSEADAIVEFAGAHGLAVRGHTLVWKRQHPAWLTEGAFGRDELLAVLREHILRVVGRYRGRIRAWDVVNEALADSLAPGRTSLRPTIWRRVIGPEYIELAFRFAHEADPDALLFYNETGAEGRGPRSDAAFALVQDLRRRGVPIHGIGMQMHTKLDQPPDTAALAWNMRRLAALGLRVHVTELEVTTANARGTPTERLARQAAIYRGVLAVCLAEPACTALVTWGVGDRYSWRAPETPLLLDSLMRPKPAYTAMLDLLRDRTPRTGTTR